MGSHIISEFDDTYSHGASLDVPLGEFLKRPVRLTTQTWTVGGGLNYTFNPWADFLNDPLVKRRLEGYRHVRGHMRIRVVVTGNPFQFGRAILAYEPWGQASNFGIGNINQRVAQMMLSQQPHIYIDASTSQGGEMTLPFFSPYNWIDLANALGPDLGLMRLVDLTPLASINGFSGSTTIAIYAWMDDATICTPTSADYNLVTYQGEMGEHLVSKPASAVAKAAGLLSRIPLIRPYAIATEMAASAIGNIASIFGYSRPQIGENLSKYKTYDAGELATTNTHEAVARLGLDAKGQLTIDPRTVGLNGIDEMSIPYVVSRECLIAAPTWSQTDTEGTAIFSMSVSPVYLNIDTTTNPVKNAVPPCTAVSLMFERWRGEMVYRFSIVASNVHRGKLLVQYDPVTFSAGKPTNEVYSRVIDLAETRDFEIPVKWHASTSWLRTWTPSFGSTTNRGFGNNGNAAVDPSIHNGQLSISVLTPLTSPDTTGSTDVRILVFPRGGHDLEFASPSDFPFRKITFRSTDPAESPQGAEHGEEAEEGVAPPHAVEQKDPMGTQTTPVNDHTNEVFFGESVVSLRSFLRRYRAQPDSGLTNVVSAGTAGSAPLRLPAREPIFNNLGVSVREWILGAYVGWRGSIRQKFVPRSRGLSFACARGYNFTGSSSVLNVDRGAFINADAIEAELPYYNSKRFSLTRQSPTWTTLTNLDDLDPNNAALCYNALDGSADTVGYSFTATGEDFAAFFFIGFPPVFLVP